MTQLFAVISALVGFLFAFNAMLLTVPQRRRLIADLRRDGYTPKAVIAVLMFDAVVLGTIACAIGLVLGDELSIHLFHSNPGYLSSAFAVGSERVVNLESIVISVVGGMGAASVAVLSPFKDIVSRNPLAAIETKEGTGGSTSPLLTVFGLLCLAATLAILLAAPQAAIVGMVTLIAALLALLAIPLTGMLALVRRIAPSIVSAVPHIAVMELRAGRSRAIAIAATGAIAVFGSVSIQGAHSDLLNGLYNAASDVNASTDVWVSAAGNSNLLIDLALCPDSASQAGRAARGALGTHLSRRPARLQRPANLGDRAPQRSLAAGTAYATRRRQRRSGRRARARRRLGGRLAWRWPKNTLARRPGLHPAHTRPKTFRVAALSTNLGWAPGSIIINAADYARAWGSQDASAYSVLLKPGVSPHRPPRDKACAGGGAALTAQTARSAPAQRRSHSGP